MYSVDGATDMSLIAFYDSGVPNDGSFETHFVSWNCDDYNLSS